MRQNPTTFILGFILTATAALMLLPAILDLADGHDDWTAFVAGSVVTGFIGVALVLSGRFAGKASLSIKDSFALTVLCWICVPLAASLPLLGLGLSFTDAFFESMSGVTTTGSTVLVGLDAMPRGILLWRALLQWIGGVGIIVMAIFLLPFLRIGGMQLFKIESSAKSEKAAATMIGIVGTMLAVYVALTALCAVLFFAFGMTAFDAICHAMSALSTGGYSTHDASFSFFANPAIEWIAAAFMLAGAFPFFAYIHMTRGRTRALIDHPEVRILAALVAGLSLAIAVRLVAVEDYGVHEAIRHSLFNVISVVTTTGFMSTDYQLWGPQIAVAFFVLTFVGGCTGSTSGGIKIYRFQILAMMMGRHLAILSSPRRVVSLSYLGKVVDSTIIFSVVAFMTAFFAAFGVVAIALSFTGLDFVTALSGAATALANVGPGLGPVIGPAGNFATVPDSSKWILAIAMLLGRLELLAILVALNRDFWR